MKQEFRYANPESPDFSRGEASTAQLKHLEDLANNNRGKTMSIDQRRKLSISRIGELNPFYNKHHTDNICEIISHTHKDKPKSYEQRMKLTEIAVGGFWYGAVTYYKYIACSKLTKSVKQLTRDRFGHCVLCKCLPEENISVTGKIRAFPVHHALEEPLAFCSSETTRMELLRKMMPRSVAHFGKPIYNEEELWYVRLLVPLCDRCHGIVTQSKESKLPYEDTIYRKYFCELVMNKYDGKCF